MIMYYVRTLKMIGDHKFDNNFSCIVESQKTMYSITQTTEEPKGRFFSIHIYIFFIENNFL